jgi:hypothetical protein
MTAETEHEYQIQYFEEEEGELLTFLKDRGLTKVPNSKEMLIRLDAERMEAFNDYGVMVNARDRKLSLFEAIRNLLIRRARRDAHSKGLDSTMYERQD